MKNLVMYGMVALVFIAAPNARAQAAPQKTKVVILGVEHSAQLVAESYQPAMFRAFIDRVHPAAIGVERSPEQLARNDHYEFTYEIQYLAVPYAREHGIPLQGVDWYPSVDDQILGFGLDLGEPPLIRPASGFQGFLTFDDSAALTRTLFYADAEASRVHEREFGDRPAATPNGDLPRRLYLYRTFMQARHVQQMAREYRGKTLLVLIGSMHKDAIERILAADANIQITLPSSFGLPAPGAVDSATRRQDLAAIATFNLLGTQSALGKVDWGWMGRVVDRLRKGGESPEASLFATRLRLMTGVLPPEQAEAAYARVAADPSANVPFTWSGVKDGRRLDSYFDPFGNLLVRQRAALEQARELYKLRRNDAAEQLRAALRTELTPGMRAQLDGYWQEYVVKMR